MNTYIDGIISCAKTPKIDRMEMKCTSCVLIDFYANDSSRSRKKHTNRKKQFTDFTDISRLIAEKSVSGIAMFLQT